ncbi:MAG: polysaccharide biosynthesis protein [Clostridia bacterium]|nr:polysaccharide biosynthesis protein [Clostridia bacterium]
MSKQTNENNVNEHGNAVWRKILIKAATVTLDILCVVIATLGAYFLFAYNNKGWSVSASVWLWIIANALFVVLMGVVFRTYSMKFSSVGIPEFLRIVAVVGATAIANVIFLLIAGKTFREEAGITFFTLLVYCVLLVCGISAIRVSKRIFTTLKSKFCNMRDKKRRVMLVGCNNDTFTLIRHMLYDDKSRYEPACIVDADNRSMDRSIYEVRVVANLNELEKTAKKFRVQEIFVTIPSTQKRLQKEALLHCSKLGLPVRMLPELSEMTNGEISVSKLRNVEISDLLGREQISVNLNEVAGYIENKVVLVTGGGGSIGSELCRQIARHNPKELIILDVYENNIYDIEQELRRHYPDLPLLTLVASIRDKVKIRDVFNKYRPQIVFNAAAHKHVPLMETSPNEAVKNNVFGTLNVAQAADEFETETFVQISTDKAVNPTNIMGATKRICEMIIQTLGKYSKKTNFVAVRFGNVLGSNGSVIPLFKRQIEEGGPVTVTHKDIIRYFMTIPEAVSLVLQAGAYAKGGQIFVLDMGEPVKIYDLAYNLIKLSGYEPNVDIDIVCTGLRPGEKLYEERLMEEEGLQQTENGLINIAQPIPLDEEVFWQDIDALYVEAHNETDQMKEWVKKLVPTYTIDNRESLAVSFLKTQNTESQETEEKHA